MLTTKDTKHALTEVEGNTKFEIIMSEAFVAFVIFVVYKVKRINAHCICPRECTTHESKR